MLSIVYIKNKIILFAIIILISSCSSVPKSERVDTLNTLIQKPEFNYKINKLPKSINIYFFKEDESSVMPTEIKGFIANSYFYNSKFAYNPKIFFSPIIDGDCDIDEKKEELIIVFNLSNNPFYLKCIEGLPKTKALYVSSFEDKLGFNNAFIVTREDEKLRLIEELTDASFRFVVIDSNNTLDKEGLKKLLEKNKNEILEMRTYDGNSSSQDLIAEILMINRSKERIRKITRRISKNIIGDVRSRDDIDSFFLSVDLGEAKSIKPALDYISEKEFNIFILNSWKTNSIYSSLDKDISGSINSDLPIMMPILLPEHIPINSRSRGFAIGYDAYEIVLLKYGGVRTNNFVYKGLSGKIELQRGKIIRTAYVFKLTGTSIEIL